MKKWNSKQVHKKDRAIILERDILTTIEKFVPRSNKKFILHFLKNLGLLPISMSNKKLPILARLLGFLFGDGTIPLSRTKVRDKLYMMFTGKKDDLIQIKSDIKSLGFNTSSIITREKKSTIFRYGKKHVIKGEETHFVCSSKTLCVLMVSLGAPIGDKAKNPFYLPPWLFTSPKAIKKEFLSAYFGSELTKPKIDKSGKNFFQPRFSINKTENLFKNVLNFIKDLEKLLSDFNVKISSYNWHVGSTRKDGTKTLTFYVLFANSIDNLINLFGKIGYRYCGEREILSKLTLEYLLFKKKIIENRSNAYKKAILLKRNGIPVREIYRKLKRYVERSNLNLWIHEKVDPKKIKPPLKKFPTFKDFISKKYSHEFSN